MIYGSLDVSQPYGPSRPVTEIALPLPFIRCHNPRNPQYEQTRDLYKSLIFVRILAFWRLRRAGHVDNEREIRRSSGVKTLKNV
jgi:hypothetical protein